MITTVLFDLDGTLLPMDQEQFVEGYLRGLCAKAAPHGYEPQKLAKSIWTGTGAMVKNTGEQRNEEVFWDVFTSVYGQEAKKDMALFEDFYRNEFQQVKECCGFQPRAKALIQLLKDKGLRLVLATNPLFPAVATESRIRWAGLQPEDFSLYTTYENSRRCKPNLEYYQNILQELQLTPQECIMVGNDVEEDMVVQQLGMKVFLLTDCLISRSGGDLSHLPQGSFEDLIQFFRSGAYMK